ncbi:thiol-disulfide oxidoreductase DCC family protein [Massilia sp. W12]|uniref:thiol-disulfide oxidoreductase DCC family protein n=1 Tax=Massilia sp. W12 TaxID=3126507 RepID=UPI0030CE2935
MFTLRFTSPSDSAPPGLAPGESVILFDGVCRLCAAWSRFLLRYDQRAQFRLATVQSPAGQALLDWCGLPLDRFDTMVLLENGRLYTHGDAFLRVMWRLGWPWRLACAGMLLPRGLRNWLYQRIANNRYHLFGKLQACVLPDAAQRARFLESPPGPP